MRHDLYYGAIISLGLHFGLASFSHTRLPQIGAPRLAEIIDVSPWPKELPDVVDLPTADTETKTSVVPSDVRPPSLPDVPHPAAIGTFVMQVEPNLDNHIDRHLITIPVGPPGDRTGTGNRIFDPSKLDQQPMAKFQAKPVYPFEAKRNGISGEVMVDFIVDQNGEVRNAYAATSTSREFEQAAVQAVSKWKFRPGKKDGRYVGTHLQVPIVFHLGDDGE